MTKNCDNQNHTHEPGELKIPACHMGKIKYCVRVDWPEGEEHWGAFYLCETCMRQMTERLESVGIMYQLEDAYP